MKTGTYHGGAFDSSYLNCPCIILEEGKEVGVAKDGKPVVGDDNKQETVEVATLLVFDKDGHSVVRRNVHHEDDKQEGKDDKGEACDHPYYEED